MRILLITQYFYPENFKSNDIAFDLVERGYEVDALVGIPNYPVGKYFKGYGIFKKRIQRINGVRVFRSFQFPRGRGNKFLLMLNYISYVISACCHILLYFVWRKYDAVIVHEPSPIFQVYPAMLLKKLRKLPLYLWVLDIWPDAMMSGGGIRNRCILSIVNKMVIGIYKHCDKILISSRRFAESILSKGNFENKIIYFPNWSEDLSKADSTYPVPGLPEGFVIMLAGNLGRSQNLDAIVEAIEILQDIKELKWVFVGDGSKKEWLDVYIREHNLTDRAFTLGRFPPEAMPAFFSKADALLVSLRGGFPHLGMVVPARLQAYMSAGRPVLAMIGDGGADIIRESNCGYAVSAGDYKALADIIRNKVIANREDFEKMGESGRLFFEKEFRKDVCIDNLCKILKKGIKNG